VSRGKYRLATEGVRPAAHGGHFSLEIFFGSFYSLDFSTKSSYFTDVEYNIMCHYIIRRKTMANETPGKPPHQISLELGEKESEGIYSNLALITHSPSEFFIDFARAMPGVKKTKVYARVVMTPQNVKMLLNALDQNIKKFEDRFGKIKIMGKEGQEIGFQTGRPDEST
jgi:hypothetical protein